MVMFKSHKVIFPGAGQIKAFHYLDSDELAMVTKALYTKQALVLGEHIILGEDGINKENLY